MPPITCTRYRLVTLGIATFVVLFLIFAAKNQDAAPIKSIKEAAQNAASSAQQQVCPEPKPDSSTTNSDHHGGDDEPTLTHVPDFAYPTFGQSVSAIFDEIKQNITAAEYVDPSGKKFGVAEGSPIWTKPLGKEVLIVDLDTRFPKRILGGEKINWEGISGGEGDGMLSASFINHFLYAQIHGYDYQFYNAKPMKGYHNTWIKPFVMDKLLHKYRFVIFIDADATITHMEVPLEWMFNRWGITKRTSIAAPIDTRQILNDDENASCDSKGKVTLNTGFVVLQNLPHTFKMMKAWKECPTEKKYKGCKYWKENWSHEQRAFSEYIRYDFNPDGDNIVEIPCDDGMGYPNLHQNHPHILSDCNGHFVRHHTIDKDMTKTDTGNAMVQGLTEIMQKTLINNKKDFWFTEGEDTKEFMDKFKEKEG